MPTTLCQSMLRPCWKKTTMKLLPSVFWTGEEAGEHTRNPLTPPGKTSRVLQRWSGNGAHNLLVCWPSVPCNSWPIVSYLRNISLVLLIVLGEISNFVNVPNVLWGSRFIFREKVLLYVCTVWPVALHKKRKTPAGGEKNIFLLFGVHNQTLYSLHQIDVTFLWKWEMSGAAQKLETLTLSPDTFGRAARAPPRWQPASEFSLGSVRLCT